MCDALRQALVQGSDNEPSFEDDVSDAPPSDEQGGTVDGPDPAPAMARPEQGMDMELDVNPEAVLKTGEAPMTAWEL